MWYRWQDAGTWQPWQQLVTTLGGMRLHGNLDFDNATGVRLFDVAGTASVSLLVSAGDVLLLTGTDASGGPRTIASMDQMSDTSPLHMEAPVGFLGNVGFNSAVPIAIPTVNGAWAGNTAGKALAVALAAYGLILDGTTA